MLCTRVNVTERRKLVCISIYIYTYVCTHIKKNMQVHISMYVYTYMCIYSEREREKDTMAFA